MQEYFISLVKYFYFLKNLKIAKNTAWILIWLRDWIIVFSRKPSYKDDNIHHVYNDKEDTIVNPIPAGGGGSIWPPSL